MNGAAGSRALLVFGREPRVGEVKTRLIPAIGAEGAAAVYGCLLSQSLSVAANVTADQRVLWLDRLSTPSPTAAKARALGFALGQQHGDDLGARMAHAFVQALDRADLVVLIGSDCPGYSKAYIEAAFDALYEVDAVIGPATDGGYVLLALRRFDPALFEGIAWGGAQVLAATRARLQRRGWRWRELAALDDLDRPEDLARHPTLERIAADASTGRPPPGDRRRPSDAI